MVLLASQTQSGKEYGNNLTCHHILKELKQHPKILQL